jgi:hypothetical protein
MAAAFEARNEVEGTDDCCASSACRAREEGNGTSLGRQSPLHDDVVVVALASHVAVVALPVDLGGKGLSHFHVVKASLSHSETVSASLSHSPWPLGLSLSLSLSVLQLNGERATSLSSVLWT